MVLWSEAPSFGTDQLFGGHVGATGIVDVARFDVASTMSTKSRLDVITTEVGVLVGAWGDGRNDGGDIYAQALQFDGTLGGAMANGANYCSANVNSAGGVASIRALGSSTAADNELLLLVQGVPNQQFGIFLASPFQGFTPKVFSQTRLPEASVFTR